MNSNNLIKIFHFDNEDELDIVKIIYNIKYNTKTSKFILNENLEKKRKRDDDLPTGNDQKEIIKTEIEPHKKIKSKSTNDKIIQMKDEDFEEYQLKYEPKRKLSRLTCRSKKNGGCKNLNCGLNEYCLTHQRKTHEMASYKPLPKQIQVLGCGEETAHNNPCQHVPGKNGNCRFHPTGKKVSKQVDVDTICGQYIPFTKPACTQPINRCKHKVVERTVPYNPDECKTCDYPLEKSPPCTNLLPCKNHSFFLKFNYKNCHGETIIPTIKFLNDRGIKIYEDKPIDKYNIQAFQNGETINKLNISYIIH